MAESNIQQELLRLFQQQQQQPNIELNTGLLSGNQQGLSDVFSNPDQAQVNALVGGLAGAVNPRGRDPALMAVAQGAQAFQNTRMQDYERRVQGEKLRQDNLKNQIASATGLGNLQQSIRKNDLAGRRFDEDTRQFGITEKRLSSGQEFQQQLDVLKQQANIAKEGDIFEDVVGKDDFGGSITAKFRRNPITGEVVQLSGGKSSTTNERRAAVLELKSKGVKALREGNDIFFDKKLDTVFGPLEMRPLIGGLTEGAIAGDSRELSSKYNRFITERVLDVARILAPVTETDVNLLMKQLAPSTTFGNAEEARNWYTGQFIPKVLSDARFNGSPKTALDMAAQFVDARMSSKEIGSVLGSLPSVEEVYGQTSERLFTTNANVAAQGRAITMPVLKAMAKNENMTVSEFIRKANLEEVK